MPWSANATLVQISNFSDFPAYPYNTGAYYNNVPGTGYVGCGPTTGAMILGYFQHVNGLPDLLTPPTPARVNEGLATANTLHGSAYMNTGTDGFGSVYNIEPGMEGYADDSGYEIDVMIHASPLYDPITGSEDYSWLNDYGAYSDSWAADGYFWTYDGSDWGIDDGGFYSFAATQLNAGIPIFLTIDQDAAEGGDHWVAMVAVDDAYGGIPDNYYYGYYDTFDTSLHWTAIDYTDETSGGGDQAIAFLRTVAYIGEGPPYPRTRYHAPAILRSGGACRFQEEV